MPIFSDTVGRLARRLLASRSTQDEQRLLDRYDSLKRLGPRSSHHPRMFGG
jgi:hypothetical protein